MGVQGRLSTSMLVARSWLQLPRAAKRSAGPGSRG